MSRFDFGKLAEIVPDPLGPAPGVEKVDAAGARHGFTSREPAERLYKNDGSKEATVPLSIRPPLSVANRFIAWCKQNRLSYWEGLNELMTRAGV
jgi:hypothetical protein